MPNTPHSSRSVSPSRSELCKPGSPGSKLRSRCAAASSEGLCIASIAPLFVAEKSTSRGLLDQLFQAVAGRSTVAITRSWRRRLGVSLFIIWFILLESLQDGVFGVIRQERHQPIAGSLQHHPGLRVRHPIGPLLVRDQPAEKQVRDDDDQQAAGQPEQEAERAIERADPGIQDHVGNPHGDDGYHDQGADEHAGDHHNARDGIVIEVGFGGRQQLRIGVERDQRRRAPSRDRQDLAHEAAYHREQAGDQHHGEQDEIEYRYRHRLVRSARIIKTANRGVGAALGDGHMAGPARPENRSSLPLGVPRAAISATRLVNPPTVFSTMPASPPASPRADSGSTARPNPSFAASFSRAEVCATGRTAPDSEISPKYTASVGSGALTSDDTRAAAAARSAAGSWIRRPPATFR